MTSDDYELLLQEHSVIVKRMNPDDEGHYFLNYLYSNLALFEIFNQVLLRLRDADEGTREEWVKMFNEYIKSEGFELYDKKALQ